jgi:hypothetical protein
LLKHMSSGAVHRNVQPPAEDSVQLRLVMDDRPKSVRQAQPDWLIIMLFLKKTGNGQGVDLVG